VTTKFSIHSRTTFVERGKPSLTHPPKRQRKNTAILIFTFEVSEPSNYETAIFLISSILFNSSYFTSDSALYLHSLLHSKFSDVKYAPQGTCHKRESTKFSPQKYSPHTRGFPPLDYPPFLQNSVTLSKVVYTFFCEKKRFKKCERKDKK
jgi:predicted transcriptional regulator of viral defense system